MKKLFFLLVLILISSKSLSQDNFEGVISFKTEISVPKTAAKDALKNLVYKFGDSLQMFYTKEGNFKRKYLNSGDSGLDYQTYKASEGKLFIKKKNNDVVQTSDVSVNSLKLISLNKLENEIIMNLNCECYEYKGKPKDKSLSKKTITLTFCFSELLPKINLKAFENYNDFFINDYFKSNQRPYLKFIMKTEDFTLDFTAVKITNIDLKKLKI